MPTQKANVEDRPRWVMVHLSKRDLDRLTARVRAHRVAQPATLVDTDGAAGRLLTWALDNCDEYVP